MNKKEEIRANAYLDSIWPGFKKDLEKMHKKTEKFLKERRELEKKFMDKHFPENYYQ
jgi:hypothetical protein